MQAECIQHGLRTLAFCKTRKLCELVTAYTRETLKATSPHLARSISVYRAGYSPLVRMHWYELHQSTYNAADCLQMLQRAAVRLEAALAA